jgi:hypothetical protein
MSPKRKALAEASANQVVKTTRDAKAPKASPKATSPTTKLLTETKGATEIATKHKGDTFKYSDANTVSRSLPYGY